MDFSKKKSVSWSVPVLKVGRDFNFPFLYCFFFRAAFPPDRPEILNEERHLKNLSFVLNWSQPDENGRPIFRYWVWSLEAGSNSTEKDVGNVTHYILTLKWDKSYNFSVVAENDQGKGEKSLSKIFITPPGKEKYYNDKAVQF